MKKWLDKKSIFNFRVYGVTEWTMTRILPNVLGGGGSRLVLFGRGGQIILFGQLIERSIGNIFLDGAFSKYGGEAGSRLSYKYSV